MKTRNRVAHGIGWFYMVTMCVIKPSIGCYLVFKNTKIWCWNTRTSKWTLDI